MDAIVPKNREQWHWSDQNWLENSQTVRKSHRDLFNFNTTFRYIQDFLKRRVNNLLIYILEINEEEINFDWYIYLYVKFNKAEVPST